MRKSWQATNQSIESVIKTQPSHTSNYQANGGKITTRGLKKKKKEINQLVWPQGREEVVYLVWRYVDKSLSHLSQVI